MLFVVLLLNFCTIYYYWRAYSSPFVHCLLCSKCTHLYDHPGRPIQELKQNHTCSQHDKEILNHHFSLSHHFWQLSGSSCWRRCNLTFLLRWQWVFHRCLWYVWISQSKKLWNQQNFLSEYNRASTSRDGKRKCSISFCLPVWHKCNNNEFRG